jgi:hypothetical protein
MTGDRVGHGGCCARSAMREAYFEIPLHPGTPEQQERISLLWNAMRAAERLSSYRRALSIVWLVSVGVVLVALRFDHTQGRTALTVTGTLSVMCLAGVLRLSWLERGNDRTTAELLALVHARSL